jgi:hypothetical protein
MRGMRNSYQIFNVNPEKNNSLVDVGEERRIMWMLVFRVALPGGRVGKYQRFGRSQCLHLRGEITWGENIKVSFNKIRYEVVNWIHLALG